MRDANLLGHPGRIAKDPRILVHFKGETYGEWSLDDSMLLDGLAHDNGVTLAQYDDWMRDNADQQVIIETKEVRLDYKLRDFPAVKKILGGIR